MATGAPEREPELVRLPSYVPSRKDNAARQFRCKLRFDKWITKRLHKKHSLEWWRRVHEVAAEWGL